MIKRDEATEPLLPFYLKYDNILNKIIDNAFFY
ncbi:Uncharacterised protein [Streptococcus pneumoniae]|nr:Uncharacterised protein [Streptococcus pneumoniae]